MNIQMIHHYDHALKGFAAKLNDEQLQAVRSHPQVQFVEVDQIMTADQSCVKPVPAESWGLTRVSQVKMDLNGECTYPQIAGEDVIAYVVDTGIYVDNVDFEGRATFGFKSDASWSDRDANGHGTHVASNIIGKLYGVARKAKAIAVKVLGDNGSGTNAGVIAGVNWVVKQFQADKKKSVINMSLGGGFSAALNAACDTAVKQGVVTVVAAGNSNFDACSFSPASAPTVLTVGSTDVGIDGDVRSYFSNYGTCVDIFGPGSDITAAWIGSPTATNTISGTSMASPHVAGVAVLYWSQNPSLTATEVQDAVVQTSTADLIDLNCPVSGSCSKSPNLMVYNGCGSK